MSESNTDSSFEYVSDPESVDIDYSSSESWTGSLEDLDIIVPPRRSGCFAHSPVGRPMRTDTPVSNQSGLVQKVEDLHLEAEATRKKVNTSSDLISVCDGVVDRMKTVREFIAKNPTADANGIGREAENVRRMIEDVTLLHIGLKKMSARSEAEKAVNDNEKTLKRLNESLLLKDDGVKRLKSVLEPKDVRRDIQGNWRMVAAKNLKPFVARMKAAGADVLEEILFESGQPHFEMEGDDVLTIWQKFEGRRFYMSTSTLGKHTVAYGYNRVSYVEDNRLHTIDKRASNGTEMNREMRFVDDQGRLHMVVTRLGVVCTRIYEKIV